MRIGTWGGALAVLLTAQAVSAQATGTTLTIAGTSTVRSWSCQATGFAMTPRPVRGFEAGVLNNEKALETVTVTFPVAAIECGNETMDGHLRKALRGEEHPEITYSMATYELREADGGVAVEAEGLLTIAGQERPITMAVTVLPDDAGGIRVKGEQEIDMTDWGVKPPKLMLGTLKVGEKVTVTFDMPLKLHPAAMVRRGGIRTTEHVRHEEIR